jgi:hypothetical protein
MERHVQGEEILKARVTVTSAVWVNEFALLNTRANRSRLRQGEIKTALAQPWRFRRLWLSASSAIVFRPMRFHYYSLLTIPYSLLDLFMLQIPLLRICPL